MKSVLLTLSFVIAVSPACPRWALADTTTTSAEISPPPDTPAPSGTTANTARITGPESQIHATRCSTPIKIDGVLNEAAWQTAELIDDFKQREPNEGAAPTQRTDVRIMYDDDAIYVGARLYDTQPDSIIRILSRRDQGGARSDQFKVLIDPYFDRRSGYYFAVSVAGTLYDGTLYNDGWSDDSWDGVWDAKAKRDDGGWSAEFKIPFSQLRFTKAAEQKWGINFQRSIGRGFEDAYVVFQPRSESGFVSRFPTLVGLQNVSPGGAIELVPYVTSKAEYLHHEPGDPFNDGSEYTPNIGGDLRMALGPKLTLNGTVNPDFGQVEVDPAVVNLSDVETFFPEKRPFFVEGSSIFNAGQQGASDYWNFNWNQPTFFYSRRIGRAPAAVLPNGIAYAEVPQGTTILGAAKLSGKPTSSVNLGFLSAVTAKEHAEIEWPNATRGEAEVEPLTYYGVARALKEFPGRQHGLGAIGTLTMRSFDDDQLRDRFNEMGTVGAIDGWHFLDQNKTWVLSGWAGASHIEGNEADIASVQTSPRHYYQRPDAENFEFDPTRTSLSGAGARVWLNKEKGNILSNSAIGFLSPGFEANDAGFMSRADNVNGHAGLGYKWTKPTKHVKNHNVLGAAFASTDFDGNLTWAGAWGKGFWWYANNWTVELRGAYNPETVNPRRSRGGPLMLNMPGYETGFFFDTDGSRNRYYYVNLYSYVQPEEDSYNWNAEVNFTYKPAPNLSLSFVPYFERSVDSAYPLSRYDDAGATNTFGKRYLFANLDQTTAVASVRLNLAFTPRMSLQFYGQPLISTAKFDGVKELARPKSLDFLNSGDPNAGVWTYDADTELFDQDGPGPAPGIQLDQSFASLRGNAVFRWEYMPGAAFYLVWTQQRTENQFFGDYNFEGGNSFKGLVEADADNIFLAKITYYLTR